MIVLGQSGFGLTILLENMVTRPRSKTAVKIVAGALAVVVVGLAAYTSLHDYSFHQRQFEPNAWKQGTVRDRGEMVESLRGQSLLHEKTREDVRALLGRPDDDHDGLLRYRIDVGRRMGWRPILVTLVVEFDDKMRVYRAEVVD